MAKVEMVIHSINVATIDYQKVVILKEKDGERYLPMWIGTAETDAIATGLQKADSPRPFTHDLICSTINTLGATLKHVVVDGLTEETSHAKAVVEKEGKTIEVDCRPSDAFAMAIRADVPIFVTEGILKETGISSSEITKIYETGRESRAKILVVDDDERYLQFVSRLLTEEGYEVDTAVDGIDALGKIKKKEYSLLLTGIRMPYMDGFELYKHVQKIEPSLASKVIVVSSSVKETDTRRFLVKNKLPYVAKPFDVKQLKSEVNRILTSGLQ